MNTGVFQISREIWESEINKKPAEWFKFWVYIIGRSNFKATKEFDRGEAFYNLPEVALLLRIKTKTLYNFLIWAKRSRQISTRKSTRGIYIKVLNYAKYQDLVKSKKQTEKQTEKQIPGRQREDRKQTIVEECNKEKNVIKEIHLCNFDIFWNAYPKKKDKKDALKKWLKIDPSLSDKIMVALQTQKQTEQWLKDDGKYIPHPSTWLNKERWEDESGEDLSEKLETGIDLVAKEFGVNREEARYFVESGNCYSSKLSLEAQEKILDPIHKIYKQIKNAK